MMIPCPHIDPDTQIPCGEMIDAEDAKWLDVKLGLVPLRSLFPDGYFSNENQQTVSKAPPLGMRRRRKFKQKGNQ